jgi:hypothetical protein
MSENKETSEEVLINSIYTIRGIKVILDRDLAIYME